MNCCVICLVFSTLLVAVRSQNLNESRVVNTYQGPVRGYRGSDGDYFVFYGVPYATEPTGRDKFKGPLPGPTWQEPLDAIDDRIVCPQLLSEESADAGQRDNCLVANIYVPITNETNVPVVVYIHGGSYFGGRGAANSPRTMVTRGNFIAVSFNYRLGVHGFLCLGTDQIPGNAGMKDMIALLRWVNRNIGSFGGNPNDVTLSGLSAGASAVDLIMLSPLSRGLIHKVIPDSGVASALWSIQQDPFENAMDFAAGLGFTSNDVYELEDYFTALSIEQVVSMISNLEYYSDSTVRAVPCVERSIAGVESFLTQSPTSIIQSGDYPKLPYLLGFTSMEGLMILGLFQIRLVQMNANFSDFMPADLVFPNNQEREEVANSVRTFYFGNETLTDESAYSYVAFFGDISFTFPTLRTVQLMAEAGSDSIYLYEYEYYDESIHRYPVPNSSLVLYGAGHCAQAYELLERQSYLLDDVISADHLRVRNTLRELWINFIRTGRPLPAPTAQFPQGWPAASANRSPHMRLDNSSSLAGVLRPDEGTFWNSIYDRYFLEPVPPPVHRDRNFGGRLVGSVLSVMGLSLLIMVC